MIDDGKIEIYIKQSRKFALKIYLCSINYETCT